MCDTCSDGPQNFLALSTIKHIPHFWAAQASSTDNACLIPGVMAAKLPNLLCTINLTPASIGAVREGGSIFPKGCREGDRISLGYVARGYKLS